MATYSAIRTYAPIFRKYKGKDGEAREKFGYMSTTANTVEYFSLETIFSSSVEPAVVEYTGGARTNQRAGGSTTVAAAQTNSNDKRYRMLKPSSTAAGHKNIRLLTWDEIEGKPGSYHSVGFRIPRIVTNLGCAQIMGALLKEKVSLIKPAQGTIGKCRGTFTIDGKTYPMLLNLPAEADRYYLGGDVIETEAEMTTVSGISDTVKQISDAIAGEKSA